MLFGYTVSNMLPNNLHFSFSKSGRIRNVYHDNKLLCTLRIDGGLAITKLLAKFLLQNKNFRQNCIEIDAQSKPFVTKGRSVFCNHILWCGKNIQIKSEVVILYQNNIVAIGKAVLPYFVITHQRYGVAVKIRDSLKSNTG